MGGCCSRGCKVPEGLKHRDDNNNEDDYVVDNEDLDGSVRCRDTGARVRLHGSTPFASMHTQQGWKGVNQDAMTLWKDFAGEKDAIFCGVFDGHGPLGHRVARYVRDALPSRLSNELNSPRSQNSEDNKSSNGGDSGADGETGISKPANIDDCNQWLSFYKDTFVNAFEELDKELGTTSNIDCICSGSTAVAVVKQREHLIIANLGDSRALLCTKDDNNQRIPVQLTVDLKPNVPSEEERIRDCRGRVFALDEEPDVPRIWLPEEDSPGLAMARAFGDFCLKDFGLISTPQVSFRKLSEKDEFVVLATDGVWDVLSNKEVIKIVSSAKRSVAAKQLVDRAVRAWRYKHPTSKVDDCAVICLFLTQPPTQTKPKQTSDGRSRIAKSSNLSFTDSFRTATSEAFSEGEEMNVSSKEEWTALQGLSRVNSIVKLPRFASVLSWRRKSVKIEEDED